MVLVFNKNKKLTLPWNNGNRHDEMKEYQTRIGLLCDIAEEASSITQVSTLLERILKIAQNTIGSAITAIFLKDESKTRVYLPITVSQYDEAARRRATMIESEIADMVAGSLTPVMINNVDADTRISLTSKKASNSIVRSVIAAPILKGKNVIGVLMGVNKDSDGDFTQRDYEVLKGFASTEALILLVSLEKTAVENVKSLATNQALVEGYRNTVHELASIINVKDDHVYEHSRRVKEYALLAASSLTLTPEELRAIEFGALLHDIGKIGIDSKILRKPGPLTDEEWQIIYEHPQKGADILEDIPHLRDAMNIVLYHHERYDGTGYPKKLKGNEIPIGARLVAVANAFDTMTTDHPYRAALSVDEAMRELFDSTGTQFCPKAIEAFVAAYRKRQAHQIVKKNTAEVKTKEVKPTEFSLIKEDKDTTKNMIARVKKDTEEIKKLKEKAAKEAKEAKIKAEQEAKIKADKEAKQAEILKLKAKETDTKNLIIKVKKEAKEARRKAEQESKEAKKLKIKVEKEAKIRAKKEAKEAKIKAKREAKQAKEARLKTEQEAKIKAEKEAKEARRKAEQEAKIKAKLEAKQAKEARIKAEKEAKEARRKAEQEAKINAKQAKEAKINAEKEAKEARIKAEQEAKEAKEAKIRAEKETKEARIKAEKEAKEKQEAKIRAEKEAKEARIKAEKEAKEKQEVKIKAEKEAKIKAEKEAKEARIKAKQEAKEKQEAKIKAEKEGCFF
jgi:putative nucleotidyltransferase with HDIG domain